MLERLRLIDWSSYSHAYGPADDTPDQIQLLASSHPRDWVGALDTLFWTIYHQGAVYDSTAMAVPFLLELLECPQVRCRGRIMELLAHVASGQSTIELNATLWDPDDIDDLCEDAAAQHELEEQRRWVDATQAAVWNGWDTYLDLGADLSKRVRICAPYLLGQLAMIPIPKSLASNSPATRITNTLIERLESEPNELVETSLLFGLEAWLAHAPEHADVLARHARDPNVRHAPQLAATLCACCLPAIEDRDLHVQQTLDALENIDACSEWFESNEASVESRHNPQMLEELELEHEGDSDDGADEDFVLPWMEEGLLQEILDRLAMLDTPAPDRLVNLLMSHVAAASQYTLENFADAIRRFVLNDRSLTCSTPREQLTESQRTLVRILFEDASYWATNVGNVELAFDAMGVPYCRNTLAEWLGVPAMVTSPEQATAMLSRIVDSELQTWLPSDGEAISPCTRASACQHVDTLVLAHIGSDAFMPLLDRFPNLNTLEIGPHTTDAGLASLPTLPLTDLTLDESITDQGMKELLRFPGLRLLNTFGAKLTDAGLEAIGRLDGLQSLYLSGTLTIAGLHALLPLRNLAELSLPKMKLTMAVLPILQQLPSLNTLSLYSDSFCEEERRRVKLELPACQIWFHPCHGSSK